jgi:hypothetical protein
VTKSLIKILICHGGQTDRAEQPKRHHMALFGCRPLAAALANLPESGKMNV